MRISIEIPKIEYLLIQHYVCPYLHNKYLKKDIKFEYFLPHLHIKLYDKIDTLMFNMFQSPAHNLTLLLNCTNDINYLLDGLKRIEHFAVVIDEHNSQLVKFNETITMRIYEQVNEIDKYDELVIEIKN